MLRAILPDAVRLAEARGVERTAALSDGEAAAIKDAVPRRRAEFVTGRACARAALAQLGVAPVPVPHDTRGAPVWPAGVVGSITHCSGFRACAVATASQVPLLGIDAEPNAPLPTGVLREISDNEERRLIGHSAHRAALHLDRLLFSAKEAVYKACPPAAQRRLDFTRIHVQLDVDLETFHARVAPQPHPGDRGPILGRWAADDDLIVTAVAVEAAHAAPEGPLPRSRSDATQPRKMFGKFPS